MKSGLGAKLRDGFFGGTIAVCDAAGRLGAASAPAGPLHHIVNTAIGARTASDVSERENLRPGAAAFAESAMCIPPHRRHRRANQPPKVKTPPIAVL
jgi:hypothetical protein